MQDKITLTAPIPLDMDHIRNLFNNRDKIQFYLDYKNSAIKEQGFLFYVSNVDIPGDVLLDCSSEEKLNLIEHFMKLPNMVNLPSLSLAVVQILLTRKNINVDCFFSVTPLTQQEVRAFITQHQQLVDDWISFFDSLYVYTLYCSYVPSLIGNSTDQDVIREKLKLNPIKKIVPELNNPGFISPNFIHVMQIPTFLEIYYSTGFHLDNMRFFTYQFTEYCYKGKSLFYYFSGFENWLLAAIHVLLGTPIKVKSQDDQSAAN